MRSHFKWLNKTYNLFNAEKIILTGGSAGGIATYLWNNYLRSLVTNPNSVYAIPDSGLFVNAKSTVTGTLKIQSAIENLLKVANVNEKTPNQKCNEVF